MIRNMGAGSQHSTVLALSLLHTLAECSACHLGVAHGLCDVVEAKHLFEHGRARP
jgi:hypothetical protein